MCTSGREEKVNKKERFRQHRKVATWKGAEQNRRNGVERTASNTIRNTEMSNQALHPSMQRLRCRLISQRTEEGITAAL